MNATSAISIISLLPLQLLWAQFGLLWPGEVSSIVARVPPVVRATKDLGCLVRSEVSLPNPQHPDTLDVDVRCGSFHDRYVVDRRTGDVTTWGDNPSKVGDRISEDGAKQLVGRARSRALSLQARKCLALEAARSIRGWGDADGKTTIEPTASAPGITDVNASPPTFFRLQRKFLSPAAEIGLPLLIDSETGHVWNAASATEVTSPGLGELLGKLITLSSPPLLSDQDALSIALTVPAVAALSQRKDCSLVVSSMLTPEERLVAPECDGHYVEGEGIAVNLRDGHISDPDTGKATDFPDNGVLARSLVSAIHEARLRIQKDVDAECGALEGR